MGWQEDNIPIEVTYDNNGVATPLRDHPFVKEAVDIPTFAKRAFEQHREVGARIPIKIEKIRNDQGLFIPKEESVAAWQKDHLPKLWDAGVLPRPLSDPKEYNITKPDDMHEGLNWSAERAGKFAALGIKHNVSKAAMGEFLALHREAVIGINATLKTSYDDAMLSLKRELGDKFDERMEDAKRFNKLIFKTPEEIAFMEETGIGNHPILLSILARLAPYAQNDSSLVESLKAAGGVQVENTEQARNALRAQLADIMGNKENPKHKLYLQRDPATLKEIDDAYKSLYGDAKIEIGGGVVKT